MTSKRLPRLGHYEPGSMQERVLDIMDATIICMVKVLAALLVVRAVVAICD